MKPAFYALGTEAEALRTLRGAVNTLAEIETQAAGGGRRRLQFDGMFDTSIGEPQVRKKGGGKKGGKRGGGKGGRKRGNGNGGNGGGEDSIGGERGMSAEVRAENALKRASEDIIMNSERYNLWWMGPPGSEISDSFKPAPWGAMHTENRNTIFTMAVVQGMQDRLVASPNDLHLFLGSARRYFDGDIVVAIESGLSVEVKAVLMHYKAVVYEIPSTLCSKATDSIFCGVEEERAPASVFRYYFYEKWAANYNSEVLIMLADFRDIIFQGDPFQYRQRDWYPHTQLALFQEFYPNMVIERCRFNRRIMQECYGDDALRKYGPRAIISSGASMGTRNAMLVWSHSMTAQLQDAPGRLVETDRCTTGGIDHAFINKLIYSDSMSVHGITVKTFSQGEGAMNTLGGLKPDTVAANLTGSLVDFWKVLKNGEILNWNGDRSPVVHQLEHFFDEMDGIVAKQELENNGVDTEWQAIKATQCLWGCATSQKFKEV